MNINVFNQQNDLIINESQVKKLVASAIPFENEQCDEVSIYFITNEEMIDMHREFFDDPTPTDCISFPMDDASEFGYRLLGEIFVCPRTAITYADEHQINPYEELTLYVIHGLLHLMGYDDIEEEDRKLMRKAEQRHLTHLIDRGLMLRKEDTCC